MLRPKGLGIAVLLAGQRDPDLKPGLLMCENAVVCCADLPIKGRLTTSAAGRAATNSFQLSMPSGLSQL